jgi:hypothetical protein
LVDQERRAQAEQGAAVWEDPTTPFRRESWARAAGSSARVINVRTNAATIGAACRSTEDQQVAQQVDWVALLGGTLERGRDPANPRPEVDPPILPRITIRS